MPVPHPVQPFLSYSREDRTAAVELHQQLAQQGITLTLDVVDLQSGDRWMQRLSDALASCNALVVLVGPAGMQRWAYAEFEVIFNRHLLRNVTGPRVSIHPVLLPGAAPEALPPFLALFQAVTWSSGEAKEPSALAALAEALRRQDENLDRQQHGLVDLGAEDIDVGVHYLAAGHPGTQPDTARGVDTLVEGLDAVVQGQRRSHAVDGTIESQQHAVAEVLDHPAAILDANHIARDPNERRPPLGEARLRQLH